MEKPKKFTLIVILALMFQMFSCVTSDNAEQNSEPEKKDSIPNEILQSTKELFNTLPNPAETAELIKNAKVEFDEKILNPVRNVPYYETSQSMAINLGVYCADLSFTCLFEQKQVTIEYLNAVKALTNDLGLVHLLKQEDIVKLESNLYNRDSIKIMVENLFLSSGDFLNDSNRPEVALLVQFGGWIEGLYIAMQLAKQSGTINKQLVDRIVEQYESLNMLIIAYENFSKIPGIPEVLSQLKSLRTIYDQMLITEKTSNQKEVPNLVLNAKAKVTPELFLSLYHEISKIRNSWTQ